jgi:hypothetical protein
MSGNTDKAAGMANEAAGKINRVLARPWLGQARQQAKGDAQQLKGGRKERDQRRR